MIIFQLAKHLTHKIKGNSSLEDSQMKYHEDIENGLGIPKSSALSSVCGNNKLHKTKVKKQPEPSPEIYLNEGLSEEENLEGPIYSAEIYPGK